MTDILQTAFRRSFTGILPKGFSEDKLLAVLCTAVQDGKEELAKKITVQPIETLIADLNLILLELGSEVVLRRKEFQLILRYSLYELALVAVQSTDELGTNTNDVFQVAETALRCRLQKLFGKDFADQVMDWLNREIEKVGSKFIPTKKERDNYNRWLTDLADQFGNNEHGLPPKTLHPGTQTKVILCPSCGLGKRVDHRTKNFKCRCGFNKPLSWIRGVTN